jgi:hypothetical protein
VVATLGTSFSPIDRKDPESDDYDRTSTTRGRLIEWAPLTLAEGVDEAALLAAFEVLQRDVLSKQPGFLHRELRKGSANQWVDIIHWESRDAVEQAMRNAQASPVRHSYFTLMVSPSQDDPNGSISLFERVQHYA